MNNIYVREMPNTCDDCPFGRCEYYRFESLSKHCPLKPLSVLLAEERKKVVQEIREMAGDYFEMPYCDACGNTDFNDVVLTGKDLTEILDDIERSE